MGGALFYWELARAGRGRWLHYARWVYGVWLIFVLWVAHGNYYAEIQVFGADQVPAGLTARFARNLVDTLIFLQTWAVLLMAPALGAGAVTDEKTKGTLEPLFLAHLWPSTIILGKLVARIAQGFLWSLATWPVLALVGLPGGLSPIFFVALAAVTILNLAGLSAVSVLASVWSRTTRSAVVSVYVLIAIATPLVHVAHQRIGNWRIIEALDANYVLDVARDEPNMAMLGQHLLLAAQVWGSITLVCTVLAIARLKPAYLRQQRRKAKASWYSFLRFRRTVSDRPIQWKEMNVGRWPAWPIWLVLAAGGSGAVAWAHQLHTVDDDVTTFLVGLNWMFMSVLVLAAGVSGANAITDERDHNTWDGILSTPLHFSEILDAKCEGTLGRLWPMYFVVHIAAGVTESIFRGGELLIGVLVSSLMAFVVVAVLLLSGNGVAMIPWGLTLLLLGASANAGWFAVNSVWGAYLVGAGMFLMIRFGHYISARSQSSWLSLLATMVLGQLVLGILVAGSSPISGMLCCLFSILSWGPLDLFGGQSSIARDILLPAFWSIGWVIAWWWGGQVFLRWTTTYLERTERIPGHHVRMLDMDMPYKPPREPRDE